MTIDPITARQHLVDDRHYKYRGCAPDPDNRRLSAGDPEVPVDAWGPYTGDGAEPQRVRHDRERAAVAICGRCPVLALCRTYGNLTVVGEDGIERLVEPEGILGGELALTRHRALIARRHDATTAAPTVAPVAGDLTDARTAQRRELLVALARDTDPERVAARANMDLRKANWHRSALVTLLGLDRERATRDQLLAAAVENRLIPRSTRIRPDGRWPYAAAPTTDGVRQRRIAPHRPVQLVLPGFGDLPRTTAAARAAARPRVVAPAAPSTAGAPSTARATVRGHVVLLRRMVACRPRAAAVQLHLFLDSLSAVPTPPVPVSATSPGRARRTTPPTRPPGRPSPRPHTNPALEPAA